MLAPDLAPLRAAVLWMPVRRTSVEGRACREYRVVGEDGRELLMARAFPWSREIVITRPDGAPYMSIKRSRWFAFTGRAEVRELPSGRGLGHVRRNGSFSHASGAILGRFRDVRSVGERSREGLLQAVADLVLEAGESTPSGPDALVLQVGAAVSGSLLYTRLPSSLAGEVRPAPSRWGSLLPRRLRDAWHATNAPRGWKLTRTHAPDDDPRLEVAAALFAAELSRW